MIARRDSGLGCESIIISTAMPAMPALSLRWQISFILHRLWGRTMQTQMQMQCNVKSMSMSSATGPNLDAQFEYEARCTHDRTVQYMP